MRTDRPLVIGACALACSVAACEMLRRRSSTSARELIPTKRMPWEIAILHAPFAVVGVLGGTVDDSLKVPDLDIFLPIVRRGIRKLLVELSRLVGLNDRLELQESVTHFLRDLLPFAFGSFFDLDVLHQLDETPEVFRQPVPFPNAVLNGRWFFCHLSPFCVFNLRESASVADPGNIDD